MYIYFAAAIRGGRQDASIYRQLVGILEPSGTVLTEHVANESLLLAEKHLSEQEIFIRDMQWLGQADVLVAELSTPSLGVGYELARAEKLGLPCLCLFRSKDGSKLSAMVSGNPYFTTLSYEDISELHIPIRNFIQALS